MARRSPQPSDQRRAAPAAAIERWWLAGGDEECPHCEQPYAYEAELRCATCDAPICPLCAARSRKRIVCPDCVGARGR